MVKIKNPFVIGTYVAADYFCDREQETAILRKNLDNGRNVALIAPRRLGKTGLIQHLFHNKEIRKEYNTLFVDLYSTNTLAEMVQMLANAIYEQLKSKTDRWWEKFSTVISSLSIGLSVDHLTGQPSFQISLGQIHSPEVSLQQIFNYLETIEKPCIVAIDEFQQIANYAEKNVEALLRTYIQKCANTHFIFSGSKRHMMTQIFNSPSRPFYQSAICMSLEPLPLEVYADFAEKKFKEYHKTIERNVIHRVYQDFDGFTWYVHMILNEMFALTDEEGTCNMDLYPQALDNVILSQQNLYNEQMSLLAPKQKMVLEAIALEKKARGVTSAAFIKKYSLPSTSSVQAAMKGLLEKELITQTEDAFQVYDYFFAHWLRNKC